MLHVHVANLLKPGAVPPGHRSERFRKRVRRLTPVRSSRAVERAYLGDLRVLVGAYKSITAEHILPALRASFPGRLATDAEASPRVKQIVSDVAKRFGGVEKQAEKMAALAAQRTMGAVDERFARSLRDSVGVNIEPYISGQGRIGKVLGQKVMDNVALIKTIPEQYFFGLRNEEGKLIRRGIVDAVADNWRDGGRWETLVDDIQEIGGVSDMRAEVIARDQTAKMNAAFSQIRFTDVGVEEYDWGATDDERTRTDHWLLNGTRHSWNDPGPLAGTIDGEPCHPGEDVECRCDAYPVLNLDALAASLGVPSMREDA